jgi:hypothetical protein
LYTLCLLGALSCFLINLHLSKKFFGTVFRLHKFQILHRFWHSLWCRDKALKEAFPDLYRIACAKNVSLLAHLESSDDSNKWNISFVRAAHD